MTSSGRQFVLIGIAAGLFAAVMLTGVVGNVVRGNYAAIPVIGSALLLAVAVIWLGIWLNQRRIQIMFRNPTPDRLIENYHATLLHARARKIPNADAAAAHLSALAATVYGQFDRAREELAAVDWEKAPPMYQGNRLNLLALIALLEKKDSAEALKLVAGAPATEATGLRDAILLAAGDGDGGDEEALKRIQRAATRNGGALPAISAWALSLRADRDGEQAEAARYRERVRAAAPYFVGLSR